MSRRKSLIAIAALAVFVTLLASPPEEASAHWSDKNFGDYLYDSDDECVDLLDPVNVAFHSNGTTSNTEAHIEIYLDWTSGSGLTKTFIDHGGCTSMDLSRASACGSCTRDHVRTEYGGNGGGEPYSFGGAHYEHMHWGSCFGHHTHSFDSARDTLTHTIRDNGHGGAGHGHHHVWLGNTLGFWKCDRTVSSSGSLYDVDI